MKYLFIIMMTTFIYSCNDLVLNNKFYEGDPFVSLSGEQEIITLSRTTEVEYMDSISISTPIEKNLTVQLKIDSTSTGQLGTDYEIQTEVKIEAGSSYGYYKVTAKSIDPALVSKTQLIIHIESCDQPNVIPGMMGIKKNNEERRPRLKTYLFNY